MSWDEWEKYLQGVNSSKDDEKFIRLHNRIKGREMDANEMDDGLWKRLYSLTYNTKGLLI